MRKIVIDVSIFNPAWSDGFNPQINPPHVTELKGRFSMGVRQLGPQTRLQTSLPKVGSWFNLLGNSGIFMERQWSV